jgi:hypothetical protein
MSLCVGVGLAAACGFRIFVPLLVVSIAAQTGHLTLTPSFAWVGSQTALIAFAAATIVEVVAYYVPWVDHLLDTMATPAAVVAGTVVSASIITGMDPFLKWTLAVIAGGGAAGVVQAGTVVTRAASTATTGGFGNPLVATGEWLLSLVTSMLAIIVPVLGVLAFLSIAIVLSVKYYQRRHLRPA